MVTTDGAETSLPSPAAMMRILSEVEVGAGMLTEAMDDVPSS